MTKDDWPVWILIGGLLLFEIGLLALHYAIGWPK